MAVTLTLDQLTAAMRLGDSPEETAEATRLLAYATEAVEQWAPMAPFVVQNEAVIRLASQMFDQPTATRGAYANALRNSGAARILMPYRIHGAGSTDDAVATAQSAIGTADNPVIDVTVIGADIFVSFHDGTTETYTLPDGALDQVARDAAAANATELDDKLSRLDVIAGTGIAIANTVGSTTGFTINATGGGGGVGVSFVLSGGQWEWFYNGPPIAGEVYYSGSAFTPGIYQWGFGCQGAYSSAQAELLALAVDSTILISQHASRYQTITLTTTPTIVGDVVTVTGTLDRGGSFLLPQNSANVTITVTNSETSDLDQVARDAAAQAERTAEAAQTSADTAITQGHTNLGSITTHIASQHNQDDTARQEAVDAGTEISNHESATNPHSITVYTDADADLRVQAAQGTIEPSNTPGTPSAGDAASWSPENHDHGFDPGHGGTGDITGIVTDSASGLAGGESGGEATLTLDLSGLDEMNGQYLHRDSDRLYVEYRSDTSNVRRQISLFELVQGLMRATNTAHNSPADNDRFFVMDVSYEGGTPRYIQWSALRARFTFNDAINLAAPDTEDTDKAPSRQAVAEAIASVTGTLVPGTEALDELRWRNNTWTPISPVATTYIAMTRGNTFTSLNQLFTDVSGEAGGYGFSADGALRPANAVISASNRTGETWELTVDAIWPVGEDAPFVWLITPTFHDWQPNFTAHFTTENGQGQVESIRDVVIPAAPWTLTIDGVPFQVAIIEMPLARPIDTDWMSVSFLYTAPAATARVVLEVP